MSKSNKENEKTPLITQESKKRVKDSRYIEKQNVQEQLEQELFKEIFETHEDCLDIVKRLNKKADVATEIAVDSAKVLAAQKEQLYQIDRCVFMNDKVD